MSKRGVRQCAGRQAGLPHIGHMTVAPMVTEVLGRHVVKPAFFRKLTALDVHKKVGLVRVSWLDLRCVKTQRLRINAPLGGELAQ